MLAINGVSAGVKGNSGKGAKAQPSAPKKTPANGKAVTTSLPPIVSSKRASDKQKVKKKPRGEQKSAIQLPVPSSSQLAAVPARSLTEEAEHLLSLPSRGDESCGRVKVRYNHYQKLFPVHNGVIKWSDIDEEYAFSFVFKGRYARDLLYVQANPTNPKLFTVVNSSATSSDEDPVPKMAMQDETNQYFVHIFTADEFLVRVHEDPEKGVGVDGLTLRSQPLLASDLQKSGKVSCPGNATSKAVALLTDELKSLAADQLDSDAARDLIERRDIEDVLFSPT